MNEKKVVLWVGFVCFCGSIVTLSADLAKGGSPVHSLVNVAFALGALYLAWRR